MNHSRLAIAALLVSYSASALAESLIPKVIGLPYDEARAAVIKSGWLPAAKIMLNEGDGYAEDFRNLNGFIEVESCSGGGLLKCGFIFTDPTSTSMIRLVTAGEGMPTVEDVQIQRQKPSGSAKPAAD